ncbi:MAG TPA: stage III sporulation protein AB [Lachnospiraceae bacterium]|nr:stage III sporulation protein AB [Lachnospiraceae bacterium]
MLRIAGAICIVCGCTGLGFYYRNRFQEALWHLRYMQQILEMFMSEIRYGKATLPECCRQVGTKVENPYKDALLAIHREAEKHSGRSFYEIWLACMEQALKEVPVTKQEKVIFIEFCSCSNHSDNQMQIRTLEQYRDMLVNYIKCREDNLEKQGRLATGLGVMSGLLIAVILI